MKKTYDIAIIGAGSGGLSVAAFAAQIGASVALIEAGKMGGDCLNTGCVPSKSLLAAAKKAQDFRRSGLFGISSVEPQMDFSKVMDHVHDVINTLSPNDSIERFTKLGVDVIQAQGRFLDHQTLAAGGRIIKARRFVIATGSSPAIPPIPGLDQLPFYTNETIFDLRKKPDHLLVIGGGPIGCELAQAFLLLDTKVTVIEAFSMLPHDDQELVSILREELIQEGLVIHEKSKIIRVDQQENEIAVVIEKNGQTQTIIGSHLLVATGRRANVDSLSLEASGVNYTDKGINVDARLRTSNKRIYAIGDVAGSYQFTHVANYHASIVLRNILFRLPTKVDYRAIPWVTYTEPELAHVGLLEHEAYEQDPKIKIQTWNFSENDRAQAECKTLGKIKVVTSSNGKILGVTILGSGAGELLLPWIMAIQEGKSIRSMTKPIIPYPTLSEINKRVASEYYTPFLFSDRMKKLVKFLSYFG
jgi:pyruvate/2-oxoglutarate dehydrogenase complex dihydrolipoamide dehydrogenase (E3) component